jgi:AcrR family transcriptional regulator
VETDTEARLPRGEASAERVVAAARACFAERGINGTRMDDVARRARMSRPNLYSFVTGRAKLLELVALARLHELGIELEERARRLDCDVAEAITDQIIATTRLGREDPEFATLAEAMPRFALTVLLTSGDSPIHQINARIFGPLLARAMADGRLRTDVPIAALHEWLQNIVTLLASRDDLDDEAQRTMVRRFVLPGLLS